MAELTADGSPPTITFEPTSGSDWQIQDAAGTLQVYRDNSGFALQGMMGLVDPFFCYARDGSDSMGVESGPSEAMLGPLTAPAAPLWVTSSQIVAATIPLWAPGGVETVPTLALEWGYTTGTLGSTSPKVLPTSFDDKLMGAMVLLNGASIPMDTPSGSLGLDTYFYMVRHPGGGTNDYITIVFDTGTYASNTPWEVLLMKKA